MGNFDSITPEKVDEMLNLASQKLGTDKEKLRKFIDNGMVEKLVNGLKPNEAKRLQQILSDRAMAEQLLSTPQAQQLLKKLLEGK